MSNEENEYSRYTDNQEEDINSYLIHSRLLQIKNLSIASLVSFILSTILLIIFSFTIPFIIWIPIIGISLSGIINIILGILILTTNWRNKDVIKDALIWGLLTLILIIPGPISSLIFISRVKNLDVLNDNKDNLKKNNLEIHLINLRLLQIKNLSIASLVSFILSTILLIIFSFTIPFIIWIPIIGISLSGIINIILGIWILTTNWRNKDVIKDALIWGLLTLMLIILGPISSLIFISRVKNLKSLETIDNSSSENQDQEI